MRKVILCSRTWPGRRASSRIPKCLTWLGLLVATLIGCKDPSQSVGFVERPASLPEESHVFELTDDQPPDERWRAQVDSVLTGTSRSIHMIDPVASEQLSLLESTPNIVALLIDQGRVQDADLQIICQTLADLEHLRLRLSPVTDLGAAAIKNLKKLRLINLPQAKLTAKGIASWLEMEQLNHVRLGGAQLDDQAMAVLAKLPHLQSLHLIGPKITENGLMELVAAKNLTSFYLDDCPIHDAAWSKLRQQRPDLHVHIDQQHPDRL